MGGDEDFLKVHWQNLGEMRDSVSRIYIYRDKYFERHPLEEAHLKEERLSEELQKVIASLDCNQEKCEDESKAFYQYLYGRALNVKADFNAEAEERLARAIKLDPKLAPAWNELGEVLCKKKDFLAAKASFDSALKHWKNKISLRNLSMMWRHQASCSSTQEEKMKSIEEGLMRAKEAVELDVEDGISWMILGNAYLSSFFAISPDPDNLRKAMMAYLKAERDTVAKYTPDLHYNKGMALKYEEDYQRSLECLKMAFTLDTTFLEAQEKIRSILEYLKKIQDLTENRGRLKSKRLLQMIKMLSEKDLGPYGGGSFSSASGKMSVKLTPCSIEDLLRGPNPEKVIFGKVVASDNTQNYVPFTFCLVDRDSTCISVTVYNLAQGKGVIIGDSVAVPEPFVEVIHVTWDSEEYKFRSVRVESPLVLVVNGKKLQRDNLAHATVSFFQRS